MKTYIIYIDRYPYTQPTLLLYKLFPLSVFWRPSVKKHIRRDWGCSWVGRRFVKQALSFVKGKQWLVPVTLPLGQYGQKDQKFKLISCSITSWKPA